ncbi:VMAP-C domain-containing protein [Lentzea indica]|uniref:VMAP-C domain-containing protein n=1 Tax=Lentzea indica TaxID=2604800 RepID=UPI00165F716D|nr:hypothetical protein [Lentzea indica]
MTVDVADFTNPSRRTAHMADLHDGLYDVLRRAFSGVGVDFDRCETEDRGDGALILVPAVFPKSELADKLPGRLVAEIRRYNSTRVDAAKIKLRVAVHSGDIRKNTHGWVGIPVNLAFRLLDAQEAKLALRRSDGVVAMIASDHFYSEVILQDPGTAPESYRRIDVTIKTFTGHAWLRLHGEDAVVSRRPPTAEDDDLGVLPLAPEDEFKELHGWLVTIETPRLPMLVSRATGSTMPVPRFDSVWDAFVHLSDVNAGPDGIPPAVLFVELLADEVGGETAAHLTNWVEQSVRKLRRTRVLDEQREVRPPIQSEPHLHLMFAIELDSIDSDRCILSFWRQDDPLEWPPPRGGVREVGIDDLEYQVDEVIIEAEGVWSDLAASVTLEFLMARPLLQLPIYSWCKEHRSGDPRPLVYDYTVALRSLERMHAKYWHRAWRVRWDSMLENPAPDRIHPIGAASTRENPIDAVLSDSRWIGLVMDEPPLARPEPHAAPEALTAALRAGLPVILWHPTARPEDLHALVGRLAGGHGGVLDLPEQRRAAHLSADVGDLVRDLVVLWDDPNRTLVLDQQSSNPAGQ